MLLKDLRQYITDFETSSGQGALLRSFFVHSKNYREYLTSILDGFISNFDVLAIDVPELLNIIGPNTHIADYSNIEWNPYEDAELTQLIADCIDPDGKAKFYPAYDKIGAVENFVQYGQKGEADKKIAKSVIDICGIETNISETIELLNTIDREKWEENISAELCDCDGEYINIWEITPSSKEKYCELEEAFDLLGFPCEDEIFWNVGTTYFQEDEVVDYDYTEMSEIIEEYAPYSDYANIEKYEAIFDFFSSSSFGFTIITAMERGFMNRKDVLF